MNDEINLPDGSENTPLSVGNAQTQLVRDLHVKGDKVYLPETSPVDFNSDEYDDEFLRSLPNDVALEASSVLNNKRNRFTLFGLAFFFLFFSSVALGLYHFFPKKKYSSTPNKVSQRNLTVSPEYKGITSEAGKKSEEKLWTPTVEELEEHANDIVSDKEKTRNNALLLRRYFDAVHNSGNISLKEKAKTIIKQVRENSPDELGWYLDSLRLNYPDEIEYIDYRNFEVDEDRAKTIKELLQNANPKRWEEAPDYANNARLLDLYWARLNFIYWCYCDPRKNLDRDEKGVPEREEAYRICKRYTEMDSVDRDFQQLKIDIIDAVIGAGTGLTEWYYYFDGEEHWRTSWLEDKLNSERKKQK